MEEVEQMRVWWVIAGVVIRVLINWMASRASRRQRLLDLRATIRWWLTSRRGTAIALAVAMVTTAMGLLIYSLVDRAATWPESAVALVLIIAAFSSGTEIFAAISSARAKASPQPLELSEDQTTLPWRMTDHSIPDQRWKPEDSLERRKDLHDFWVRKYARLPRGILPGFKRLLEDTSSINYRVTSVGKKRFLRLHRKSGPKDIECHRRAAEALIGAKVFPARLGNYVVPLRLKGKHDYAPISGVNFGWGEMIGEVFPYLKGVEHFAGRSPDELRSVGRLLGKVQMALQDLDEETVEFLKPLTDKKRNRGFDNTEELQKSHAQFKELLRVARHTGFAQMVKAPDRDGNKDETCISRWFQEVMTFRETAADIADFRNRMEDVNTPSRPLLFDVHPHNVFFRKRTAECVLIYDYERLGFWPHGHVVAFSLHRFAREFVIRQAREAHYRVPVDSGKSLLDTPECLTCLCRAARKFLRAYVDVMNTADNRLDLPEDFASSLADYVKSANIEKLLHALIYALRGRDELGRGAARVLGEARKFIGYMKEADEFGSHKDLEVAVLKAISANPHVPGSTAHRRC